MSDRKIISDKLVISKTGKSLEDWFKVLDKKGAREMNHADIFELVSSDEGLKPLGQWNQNLLTTSYEWDRGLKERGQKGNVFEISLSKTIKVPAGQLYRALIDKNKNSWVNNIPFNIRKETKNKSIVISWNDSTTVRIEIYNKGEEKSQVVVQHMKIHSFSRTTELKKFWSEALNNLKDSLKG